MRTMPSVSPIPRLHDAEEFLHQRIPLTRSMGIRIAKYDDCGLVIEAPLALNHNHMQTAFGGSLNAIATLAGYAFLWLEINDPECHVVIAESSIKFRRPVNRDIRAICRAPGNDVLSSFKRDFSRKGKARIVLHVTIPDIEDPAVEFQGTFVAFAGSRGD